MTRKSGQALVEYALLLAFMLVVVLLAVRAISTQSTSTFDNIQGTLNTQGLPAMTPTPAGS
jgi:Flp pilus assembly pilin Flp